MNHDKKPNRILIEFPSHFNERVQENRCRKHNRLYGFIYARCSCISLFPWLLGVSHFFQSLLLFLKLFFYSFNAYVCLSISSITSAAKTKPIIAEPEIHGSHSLDNVTGFLLLMSEGLVHALESAHGPEQVNQVGILFFVCIFFNNVQLSFANHLFKSQLIG